MKKIVVKVEKSKTAFSAYTEKYPAFTTARNSCELIKNMVDSINTYLKRKTLQEQLVQMI